MKPSFFCYCLFLVIVFDVVSCQTVSTFAGSTAGFADGQGTSASFNYPMGIAVDSSGNVYIADNSNSRIRKITPGGLVSTFAGGVSSGAVDGQGTSATFSSPQGAAVDSAGNIYIADSGNNKVRKITPGGLVSTLAGSGTATFADGQGVAASFSNPFGMAVDLAGNVYVADRNNHRIRKITSGGLVSTLAGSGSAAFANGQGTSASFNTPWGVAVDSAANVYVGDVGNSLIRKITPGGLVSTLAGSGTATFADGQGAAASFYYPSGLVVDSAGNIYVVDLFNHRIRKITSGGLVSTLAGSTAGAADGQGTAATFDRPHSIAMTSSGIIYIADPNNQKIRMIAAPCAPGTFISGSICSPCSAGTFSSTQGSPSCTACPVGTISVAGSTICSSCPGGTFANITGSRNCSVCDAGFFSQTGSSNCSICPSGLFSQSGSSSCSICPSGSFSGLGSRNCTICPSGSFSQSRSSNCSVCPAGSFSFAGSPNCTLCPAGSVSAVGSGSCSICSTGSYCPISSGSPIVCPGNSTTLSPGAQSLAECVCLVGFFGSAGVCQVCEAGKYCQLNVTVGEICRAGYFCPRGSINETSCPIGTICPNSGMSAPISCPRGFYCDGIRMAAGNACPANSNTSSSGSTSVSDCVCNAGYVSDGNGNCIIVVVSTTAISSSPPITSVALFSGSTIPSDTPQSSVSQIDASISTSVSFQETSSAVSISVSRIGGGIGAAFRNPIIIGITAVTCSFVLISALNVIMAYRRISKSKLRRKVGITTNLTNGGGFTNGRSTTTAEA